MKTQTQILNELAKLEAEEPLCECVQYGPADFDSTYCDYHRLSGQWRRSIDRVYTELEALRCVSRMDAAVAADPFSELTLEEKLVASIAVAAHRKQAA